MQIWDIEEIPLLFSKTLPDRSSHHPGFLQILFRQFTTTVYYDFETHNICLHIINYLLFFANHAM